MLPTVLPTVLPTRWAPTTPPSVGSTAPPTEGGFAMAPAVFTPGAAGLLTAGSGHLSLNGRATEVQLVQMGRSAHELQNANTIQAQIGHVVGSVEQPAAVAQRAVHLNATLVDVDVYSDWLTIRVAVQVKDTFGNTAAAPSTVVGTARQGGRTATGACTPEGTSGVCVLRVSVSLAWLYADSAIGVACNIAGISSAVDVGTVTPHAPPTTTVTNNLVVQLPARPVEAGGTFSVTVLARTEFFVEAARAMLVVDPTQLQLLGQPVLQNTAVWTTQVASTAGATNIAVVKSATADTSSMAQGNDHAYPFVILRYRVASGASFDTSSFELRVYELNAPVMVNPGGQIVSGAGGWVHGSTIGAEQTINQRGTIAVVHDVPTGVMAWPSTGHADVTNFAPLTETDQSIGGIAVQAIYPYGATRRTLRASDLSCAAAAGTEDTWAVTSTCSDVVFRPDHQEGNPDASISAEHTGSGHTATIRFRVWAPELPLTASPVTIKPLSILTPTGSRMLLASESGCRTRFQRAPVRVAAQFSSGPGLRTPPLDVSPLVLPNAIIGDTAIADLDATSWSITGKASGQTELRFGAGLVPIHVVNDSSVVVSHMEISIISSIDMTLDSVTASQNGVFTADLAVHIEQTGNMTQVGEEGQQAVLAVAIYSDPSTGATYRELIDVGIGLNVTSMDTSVIEISNDGLYVRAIRSGASVVRASWNEGCAPAHTMEATAEVTVDLPMADDAWVASCGSHNRLDPVIIAHGLDAAAALPRAISEQCIGATLAYPEYRRMVGTEPTTEYAVDPRLFAVVSCASGTGHCLVAMPGVSGEADLVVRFRGQAVIARLRVIVIQASELVLTAHPYPTWSGSRGTNRVQLRQIGTTGEYQSAELVATVVLSDGRRVAVSNAATEAMQGIPADTPTGTALHILSDGDVIGVQAYNGRPLMSKRQAGQAVLVASFAHSGGRMISANLSVTTDSAAETAVQVSSITDVQAFNGRGRGTVYGLPGSSDHTVRFGAVLDDGSQISRDAMSSFFDASFRSLLVTFSSSDQDALECDVLSGRLSLLQNRRGSIDITVTAQPIGGAPLVAGTASVYANLQASNLDVDLASSTSRVGTGAALVESVDQDEEVDVQIFITSRQARLQTLQLELSFDNDALQFVMSRVRAGSGWTSEVLGSLHAEDDGRVVFGGTTAAPVRGENLHFATITFIARSARDEVQFSGSILTMMDDSGAFLRDTGTAFVAGNGVGTRIRATERRRNVRNVGQPASVSSAGPLASPAAGGSVQRMRQRRSCQPGNGPYELGDVNTDCAWTFEEIGYVMNFTVYTMGLADTSVWRSENPWATTIPVMDANGDGSIEAYDVSIFLRVWFGMMRFVTDIRTNDTEGCSFNVDITVKQGSNAPNFDRDPAASSITTVFALVTGPAAIATELSGLESVQPLSADAGRYAGLLLTEWVPAANVFRITLPDRLLSSVGISVLHAVRTSEGWQIPFGGNFITSGQQQPELAPENAGGTCAAELELEDQQVEWQYRFAFWPRLVVAADPTATPCGGTYQSTVSTTETTLCEAGEADCFLCLSARECRVCTNRAVLSAGVCSTECPNGQIGVGGNENGIGSRCEDGSYSPTSAPSTAPSVSVTTPLVTATASTPITTSMASTPQQTCFNGQAYCIQCLDAGQCRLCARDSFFSSGQCVLQCPVGTEGIAGPIGYGGTCEDVPSISPSRTPTTPPTLAPTTTPPTLSPTTTNPSGAPTVYGVCNATDQAGRSPRYVTAVATVQGKIFSNGISASDGASTYRSVVLGLINSPPGATVAVDGSWGPFEQQATVTVPRNVATQISVVLLDSEVDEHTRRVRVQCQVYDQHFNTRGIADSSRCYVKLSATSGALTREANCAPNAITGRCLITISSINDQMLQTGDIAVQYGLSASPLTTLTGQTVTAHPPVLSVDASALENNFVLTVPSRSLYAGEVFTATVTVRAAETFGAGTFMIDINSASASLEFVEGSVVESSSSTWTMAKSSPLGTSPSFVLVQLIPYVPQRGNQADQPVLTVRLRVKSSAVNAQAGIGLRVFEFGVDDRPVDPGAQRIPTDAGSWVSGHVIGGIGAGVTENGAGSLSIKANGPVGLFASTFDGSGLLYNLAPLTGADIVVATVAQAYYPFGSLERQAALTCDAADLAYASIGTDCGITMGSIHTTGVTDFVLTAGFGGIETDIRVHIFAPADVEVQLDATSIGVLSVSNAPLIGGPLCSDPVFATLRVRLFSAFSNTDTTTESVDVTSAVRSRLVSSNTDVATVDTVTGTVTGIATGTTTVFFGDFSNGHTADITVDESDHWRLEGLYTRTFSSLSASTTTSGGVVSLQLQLLQSSLTRVGAAGRIEQVSWAEFVSESGAVMLQDLSHSSALTYAVDLPDVIRSGNSTESSLGYVEAQGNGHALVFAQWTPQCSSTTVESSSCIAVELEEADSLRITNGANNNDLSLITLAHPRDTAFAAGAVGSSGQRIGAALVFASYIQTAAGNSSAEFTVDDDRLVTIGPCAADATAACLLPMPGVSGLTTVRATHGSLTASVIVNVVKAVSIQGAMFAHPTFRANGGMATIDTLQRFGSTSSYQRARLQVTLALSSGPDLDISTHVSTSYSVANGSAFTIFSTRLVRATSASDSETSSEAINIAVSGRDGDPNNMFLATMTLAIDRQLNPTAALSAVRVVTANGATQSTVHGVVGSTYQVRFSATFADGFELASTDMIGDQFGPGFVTELFNFSSDHADQLPVSGTGGVSIQQNVLGTAAITVSSAGTDGSTVTGSTVGLFVNLRARDLQIDVATSLGRVSSGQPLADSSTGEDVTVQLFLTTTSNSIGAVDLRLVYDSEKFEFVSVAVGGDFGGAMNGELDSSESGVVSLAGATTNYVRGADRHIANVNFRAVAGGVAEFSGRAVEYIDGRTSLQIAHTYPVSFGAVGDVAMSISGERRERRQPQHHVQRRQQAGRNCSAGLGPDYPVGDSTGDCRFNIADVLITMEYLVRSNGGAAVINAWFAQMHASGAIQGGLTQTTMDVDGSTVVMAADATLMLKALFGFSRFVVETSATCASGSTMAQLTATVEQTSSETSFATDPARALETAVYFIVTGAATQNLGAQWIVDNGRFTGAVAATVDQASGVFTAQVDAADLPVPFGVSVVVLVYKPRLDQWLLGSWLPGPVTAPQTESGFEGSLAPTDDHPVQFSWSRTFAPRITVNEGCYQAATITTTSTTASTTTSRTTTTESSTTSRTVDDTTSSVDWTTATSFTPSASPSATPTRAEVSSTRSPLALTSAEVTVGSNATTSTASAGASTASHVSSTSSATVSATTSATGTTEASLASTSDEASRFRTHSIVTAMPPGDIDFVGAGAADSSRARSTKEHFFDIAPWITAGLAVLFLLLVIVLVRKKRKRHYSTLSVAQREARHNNQHFDPEQGVNGGESLAKIVNPLFVSSPSPSEPFNEAYSPRGLGIDAPPPMQMAASASLAAWDIAPNAADGHQKWQLATNHEVAAGIKRLSELLRTDAPVIMSPRMGEREKDVTFVIKYLGAAVIPSDGTVNQLPASSELFGHSKALRDANPPTSRSFKLVIRAGQLELHPHGTLARMRGTLRRKEISDEFFAETTVTIASFASCYLDHHAVCLLMWRDATEGHELHMYQCRNLAHARKLEVYLSSYCGSTRANSATSGNGGYRDVRPMLGLVTPKASAEEEAGQWAKSRKRNTGAPPGEDSVGSYPSPASPNLEPDSLGTRSLPAGPGEDAESAPVEVKMGELYNVVMPNDTDIANPAIPSASVWSVPQDMASQGQIVMEQVLKLIDSAVPTASVTLANEDLCGALPAETIRDVLPECIARSEAAASYGLTVQIVSDELLTDGGSIGIKAFSRGLKSLFEQLQQQGVSELEGASHEDTEIYRGADMNAGSYGVVTPFVSDGKAKRQGTSFKQVHVSGERSSMGSFSRSLRGSVSDEGDALVTTANITYNPDSEILGAKFVDGAEAGRSGVYIAQLIEGTPARRCPALLVGQRVLAVNGVAVETDDIKRMTTLIQSPKLELRVGFDAEDEAIAEVLQSIGNDADVCLITVREDNYSSADHGITVKNDGTGNVVQSIMPHSPAAGAGIKAGMKIVAVNTTEMATDPTHDGFVAVVEGAEVLRMLVLSLPAVSGDTPKRRASDVFAAISATPLPVPDPKVGPTPSGGSDPDDKKTARAARAAAKAKKNREELEAAMQKVNAIEATTD